MDHKVINEIRRINDIMSGKIVLSEQRIVPEILKRIFNVVDDDVARRVVRATDDTYDDIIRKLRAGESLSDDAMELLLKVIENDLLAKSLVDQKLLGDKLNVNINKIIETLKKDASRYDELTSKMDDVIDFYGDSQEFPEELIDAIKKDVRSKIDDGVGSASRAGSKIAELGASVFRKIPFVSRNLKTIVTILAEQRKGIQVLKKEIDDLFNVVITGEDSLKNLKRTIEDKLATIERISDNSAKKVLDEIDEGYKQLKEQGKISKAEYDSFVKDKETITNAKFWNEFIAPNYAELDKQVNGLGSFFRNGIKAFSPVNLSWTKKENTYGWVPKASLNREFPKRLFNFLAFNSAQTSADILKRLIKSDPNFLSTGKVWVNTYLRAIGPQLIIPFANAAFWTVWIPSTEFFQSGADKLGIDVDWDIYETTFSELLADLWFDNLLDIWNKDPKKDTQLELGDFRPLFRSRLAEMIKSFGANNDYKVPTDTTSTQSGVTTTTNNSELSIPDDLKAVFPDSKLGQIKMDNMGNYYWSDPKYKIRQNPTTNEWEVLEPGSGWYVIDKNM
jgi:hypothetical protein